MNALTYMDLLVALLSVVSTGTLIMIAMNRSSRMLHDEIAERIEQSITVIGELHQNPPQR
jgi:hypothetical protein